MSTRNRDSDTEEAADQYNVTDDGKLVDERPDDQEFSLEFDNE